MNNLITSVKNPIVTHCKNLREKKHRLESKEFLVEGSRELKSAIANDYKLKKIILCPEIKSEKTANILKSIGNSVQIISVNSYVFSKIAIRVNTDGIIGIFEYQFKDYDLKSLTSNGYFVIVDGVEKPGNLGAILRTADATGIRCVFVVNSNLDIFNPNVIRASLGTTFSVPCISIDPDILISHCKINELKLYALTPYGSKNFFEVNFKPVAGLVFGSEAYGISQKLQEQCNENIHLPMLGQVDSLNLSVTAGVIMYHLTNHKPK